jgi:REP element-mobilizing transposase RayT
MKNRKFIINSFQHIYQRTIDKGVIFYSIEDYLVFLTIVSVYSKTYMIVILCMCIMINHFHILIHCNSKNKMSIFMNVITSVFAKEYNREHHRTGALFNRRYGSASKYGNKFIRAAMCYILNNPVEKNIVSKVENYKWNFLTYMDDGNVTLNKKKAKRLSIVMQNKIDTIKRHYSDNRYLRYSDINNLYINLSKVEIKMIQDYIIMVYMPINKNFIFKYFNSYKSLLKSLYSNTGSEYEIKESFDNESDEPYDEMIHYIINSKYKRYLGKFHQLSNVDLDDLFIELIKNTNANSNQICKFLHISR